MKDIFEKIDSPFYVARQGSAFCVYFMDHAPQDYHDILTHHDFDKDRIYRSQLIEENIFNFPLPIKQGSISYAHTLTDIEETLDKTKSVVQSLFKKE